MIDSQSDVKGYSVLDLKDTQKPFFLLFLTQFYQRALLKKVKVVFV